MARERLPETRECVTRKIRLGGIDFFVRVGLYPDGRPGELFVTQSGESGSHVAVLADGMAQAVSIALQHGAPLRTFVAHWRGTHAGDVCGTPSADTVQSGTSILDAMARWMELRFAEFATGVTVPPPPVNATACDVAASSVPLAEWSAGGAGGAKGETT